MNRLLLFLLLFPLLGRAQVTFPVNGAVSKELIPVAFVNCNLQVDESTLIGGATLLIAKDRIIAAGRDVAIPKEAVVYDMKGLYLYPAFVDPYSSYGMPEVKKADWSPTPQYSSNRKGTFGWNEALKADTRASDLFAHDEKTASALRALGFGSVISHNPDGVSRGLSALVNLGSNEPRDMLVPVVSAHYAFDKGSSRQEYPSSLMGAIALLRQAWYDAAWYQQAKEREGVETNLVLQALNESRDLPQVFDVSDKWNILRADKIGDEFGFQYIFTGGGDEYQRLDEVKAAGGALILPLNFPTPYDISDAFTARMVPYSELKHWEMAVANAAEVEKAGMRFVFTANRLKDKKQFLPNIRKAIAAGLSEEAALEAITSGPASLFGLEDLVGALRPGMQANFIICSAPVFDPASIIYETWVGGERFVHKDYDIQDISGTYNLTIGNIGYTLEVKGDEKLSARISHVRKTGEKDTLLTDAKISQDRRIVSLQFEWKEGPQPGLIRMSGNVYTESRIWDGKANMGDGSWLDWVAVRQASEVQDTSSQVKTKSAPADRVGSLLFPFSAYGFTQKPEQENLLIRNATLWTCDSVGKIEKGEMLVIGGKIVAVGQKVDVDALFPKNKPEYKVLDLKGKHVSPGIIDEHSHIAVERGVNEGTQASSAEVRIGDVIDPEDINIYRQLAGGVTAAQLLHGSANPIGGQSALIKLKWGENAEGMKIDAADGFIKFALGENVKQSNWGDRQTTRFPQTRMGVEQVYYDHFIRAREYGEEWNAHTSSLDGKNRRPRRKTEPSEAPRRDLELDALLEILQQKRFISCHSYVQSEINMLMHVADSMGFRVNTFTHILEGYKVADKMKEHGAGGSSFSDWWAYKFEVKDAIPYNGAILWEQGVVTAFNSDDAEMARRLNQEAAKAVKYGGVPEEEALKFVTLNPAILLHLDHRMGSLSPGKDADFVVWSDHPLSIYAKAEMTFIEGVRYFDKDRDLRLRSEMQLETARITEKMLGAAASGEPVQSPKPAKQRHYHCDTLEEGCYEH